MAGVLQHFRVLCIFIFLSSIPNVIFTNYTPIHKTCNTKHVLSKYQRISRNFCCKKLAFSDWDFEETSLLLETFPVDPETRNYVRQVRKSIFSYVKPTSLRTHPTLVAVSSDVLADILDIEPNSVVTGKSGLDFVHLVSGADVTSRGVPLAHRYGGHQFGEWSGQLGDGRAIILGEYVNSKGERWELQLKGSGKTPYSRHGDGRAVLRSSVREFLASEAMYHLGIPTSRAASLVVSKDPVWRDQFYDGHPMQERAAVVLRVAKSWFRIGSLEILTSAGEIDLLRKVVDFVIDQHFPDVLNHTDKYLEFFSHAVAMTADMIARWQAAGFAHGVCNTDNFSLLSITIDYGPFGFLDEYNTDFVPNSSDDEGRYSYRNQPNIGYFNLEKLLDALTPLLDVEKGRQILHGYTAEFNSRFMDLFRLKLGLINKRDEDEMLVKSLLWMMETTRADFTMTFRELGNLTLHQIEQGIIPSEAWALAQLSKGKHWQGWLQLYLERLTRNGDHDTDEERKHRMDGVNPRYILRNWMAESAIEKANKDDFTELQQLLRILQRPYHFQELAEKSGYASPPPPWASKLRVSCSS